MAVFTYCCSSRPKNHLHG